MSYTLPQTSFISIEQAVIACVLVDQRVLRQAAEELVPMDFEDLRLGAIFEGMLEMRRKGEHVDVLTVGPLLASWNIRGITDVDLHHWISDITTAAAIGSYAATVREASMRRGIRDIGVYLTQASGGNDLGLVIAGAQTQLHDLVDLHTIRKLQAKSLRDIMQGGDDYDWVIPGLLERGDRLLVTGAEGGGKSTLVRQLAIASGSGVHPFNFDRMKAVKVLVIDTENSEKQWRRAARPLMALATAKGYVDPGDIPVACIPRLDLRRDSDLNQIHELVAHHRPDVLFIGPLYRLVPIAINNDDDAAPLLASLDSLREQGLAMVIEAHAGHALGSGGERDLRPRGSAALLGWPEFGLGIRKDRDNEDLFRLVRWRGDRDQREWPDYLRRGVNSWPWIPAETTY